jgi:hypothetical protein
MFFDSPDCVMRHMLALVAIPVDSWLREKSSQSAAILRQIAGYLLRESQPLG